MNKADLKNFVAEDLGTSKRDAGLAVDAVVEGIKDGLLTDGKVTLVGFGTFELKKQAARKARNPKTGEEIDVPEKTVPKFKAAQALKDAAREVKLG